MHVIVVNEKDLELNNSVPNEEKKQSNGLTGSEAPTLAMDSDNIFNDITRTPVKKKRKSLAEVIPAFGILLSILSVVSFSVASLIVKVLTELHSLQILSIRCMFQVIFYMIPIIYNRQPFFGIAGHRLDLAVRACCGTSAAICIYMAYRLIPLADATTIQFTAPVIVIFLAVFILKEPLTLLQVIVGFVTLGGVIIIAKPHFIFGSEEDIVPEGRTAGLIFAIVATLSTASVMIILRRLKTTPVAVVATWFSLVAMVTSLIICIAWDMWVWPSGWRQYGLLVAIGILGITDQYFMTKALHYEGAGPVALTRTLNIVLAFVWDVLILAEEFDWTSIVGAVLVTICITLLGMSKWKQEKPEQFNNCKDKCCCCCYSDNSEDEECEVLIVRKQSQPYYDSIDDKGYVPVVKQMERNESCISFKSKDEIVVDQNSECPFELDNKTGTARKGKGGRGTDV